jgi:hypothetical protein
MSLPKLDTPKFTLTVPSTGKELKYRPFVVREQKIMLQAVEMQDTDQLNNAVEDIIKACTFGEFDVNNSPVYDVEYVLLHIRAKSAGEMVEMFYRCNNVLETEEGAKKCGSKIPVAIPLMDVPVERPEGHDKKIMLNDTIGMTMRDLPYGVYKTSTGKKNLADVGIEMVAECVENVFSEDMVSSKKDFTQAELIDFLEGLTGDQFEAVEKFLDTTPRLEMKLPMKCPSCGSQDTVTLRGLDDFLV